MALKSVDNVDDGLFSTEIAYLVKNFRNFLRNNNRMAKNRNNVDPKNVKKNDTVKITILRNQKIKLVNLPIVL